MKRTWVVGLACGLVGLAAGALVPARQVTPAAAAQAPGGGGRFQVSAWAAGNGFHGAYVVDQQTGDVFLTTSLRDQPQSVGKAGK